MISLTRNYGASLIVDECYTDIYSKTRPLGILEACKKLKTDLTNIISFHSLSKRSNVPGIRSGFAVGDKYLIQNFKKLRHYCAGQQPLPIQEVATALWNEDSHSEKNRQKYIKKFAFLIILIFIISVPFLVVISLLKFSLHVLVHSFSVYRPNEGQYL